MAPPRPVTFETLVSLYFFFFLLFIIISRIYYVCFLTYSVSFYALKSFYVHDILRCLIAALLYESVAL